MRAVARDYDRVWKHILEEFRNCETHWEDRFNIGRDNETSWRRRVAEDFYGVRCWTSIRVVCGFKYNIVTYGTLNRWICLGRLLQLARPPPGPQLSSSLCPPPL
jgi:hypothetical protein